MDDQKGGILPGLLEKLTKGKTKQKRPGLLGAAAHGLKIPGFKHGGRVKKTGIYKLHEGETVVPAGVDPAVAHHRKHKLGHKN